MNLETKIEQDNNKLLLTLKEAAAYIGVGINKIYELSKRSDFPCVKVGTKRLAIKSELSNYLLKNKGRSL